MANSPPGPTPNLSVVNDDAARQGDNYSAGDVIADKYQLLSVIGRGGMGSVWLARNLVLNIDVAIKVINREVASREASERLLVEARSAAQLGHPSIVRIHDFGVSARGDPFIVMELLQGESLANVLERKGTLPEVNAVQTLLPIASALAAAHAKGVVHRDLKPENIFLIADETGTVIPKLVDFGVAKMGRDKAPRHTDAPTVTGNREARLTQVGRLIGSPTYMAPEQARGDFDLDERADVWSLSVVLYETIAGCPPFDDDDIEKVLLSVLADDPIPITAYEVGDNVLWSIIERGLKKRREERWQSARDMGYALAQWLVDRDIDVDIAGAAVRKHWLGDLSSDPLSDLPTTRPPLSSSPRISNPRISTPRTSSARTSRPPGARNVSLSQPRISEPPGMRRRLVSGASVDFHESAEDLVVELRKTSRSTRLFWVFALLVTIAAAGGGLLLVYSGRLAESVPSDAPTAVEPPETPAPDDRQEPSTAAVEPSEKPVAQTASSASASPATPPSSRPHTSKGAKKTKPARKEGEPPGELVIPDEPNF